MPHSPLPTYPFGRPWRRELADRAGFDVMPLITDTLDEANMILHKYGISSELIRLVHADITESQLARAAERVMGEPGWPQGQAQSIRSKFLRVALRSTLYRLLVARDTSTDRQVLTAFVDFFRPSTAPRRG